MYYTALFFVLALVVASVSAFSTSPRPAAFGTTSIARPLSSSSTARFMFSADDDKATTTTTKPSPLTEVSAEQASSEDPAPATEVQASEPSSVVRDMNTGETKEVKWVDPAMSANTDPFNLGWAYVFVFFPILLLLNDALHFLPSDGPLAFIGRY